MSATWLRAEKKTRRAMKRPRLRHFLVARGGCSAASRNACHCSFGESCAWKNKHKPKLGLCLAFALPLSGHGRAGGGDGKIQCFGEAVVLSQAPNQRSTENMSDAGHVHHIGGAAGRL